MSGSTGQTELLVEHVRGLRIALPEADVQREIVQRMADARSEGEDLARRADDLRDESADLLAIARRDMVDRLAGDV